MTTIFEPRVQIRGEFCIETTPQPCGMVIFGASGDLTARKLIPSLYHLYRRKLLSKDFYMIGCARSEMTDDQFREKQREHLLKSEKDGAASQVDEFLKLLYYSMATTPTRVFTRNSPGGWKTWTPTTKPAAITSSIFPRRPMFTRRSWSDWMTPA
jgi:hypothetical protein